jgi:hypothetical protein
MMAPDDTFFADDDDDDVVADGVVTSRDPDSLFTKNGVDGSSLARSAPAFLALALDVRFEPFLALAGVLVAEAELEGVAVFFEGGLLRLSDVVESGSRLKSSSPSSLMILRGVMFL